jgi:hypothetical protein
MEKLSPAFYNIFYLSILRDRGLSQKTFYCALRFMDDGKKGKSFMLKTRKLNLSFYRFSFCCGGKFPAVKINEQYFLTFFRKQEESFLFWECWVFFFGKFNEILCMPTSIFLLGMDRDKEITPVGSWWVDREISRFWVISWTKLFSV